MRETEFKLNVTLTDAERRLEAELEIDAPPDEVWRALTEARELMNWFPFQAEVEPGEGGTIHVGWDGAWESDMGIQVWRPGEHLRTTWPWGVGEGPEAQSPAVLDWYLEPGEGGGTRLRLVHSGFPNGEEWDDVFDSTRRGWSYELSSLRHYVENHSGRRRRVARVRRTMNGQTAEAIWNRLWSSEGLIAGGTMDPISAGERYDITMPGGIRLSGRILVAIPPYDLGATVEGAENSLLRVGIEHWSGADQPPEVQLWLATWGELQDRVEAIEEAWESVLDRIFDGREAAE